MPVGQDSLEGYPPLPSALALPKRVDDEKHHRNRDAGVRHVKRRPGIGVLNVQIEKKKVDHVSVQEAIGEIPQNPSKQQRK